MPRIPRKRLVYHIVAVVDAAFILFWIGYIRWIRDTTGAAADANLSLVLVSQLIPSTTLAIALSAFLLSFAYSS
jgi:hypothetical protein